MQGRESLTPLSAFNLLVDDFIHLLKHETDRYARQSMTPAQRGNWKSVIVIEIKKFLATIIHMSTVKKPCVRDYFSTDPVIYAHSRFMSLCRVIDFRQFWGTIILMTIGQQSLKRTLITTHYTKLGHSLTYRTRFKNLYTPSSNLTIDEAIASFKGRVSFQVYMKNKPQKYGVRIECVADAANRVVIHNMEIYTGQAGGLNNTVKSLVLCLLEDIGVKKTE